MKIIYAASLSGVVERPFNVDVNAVMNDSAAEVAGQCGWRYTGDLTMVAFFDVKVLVDEEEVVNIRVPSNTQQVFFRTEKGSTYSVSVAAVDHCNAYETSESYQFMPRGMLGYVSFMYPLFHSCPIPYQ